MYDKLNALNGLHIIRDDAAISEAYSEVPPLLPIVDDRGIVTGIYDCGEPDYDYALCDVDPITGVPARVGDGCVDAAVLIETARDLGLMPEYTIAIFAQHSARAGDRSYRHERDGLDYMCDDVVWFEGSEADILRQADDAEETAKTAGAGPDQWWRAVAIELRDAVE